MEMFCLETYVRRYVDIPKVEVKPAPGEQNKTNKNIYVHSVIIQDNMFKKQKKCSNTSQKPSQGVDILDF